MNTTVPKFPINKCWQIYLPEVFRTVKERAYDKVAEEVEVQLKKVFDAIK